MAIGLAFAVAPFDSSSLSGCTYAEVFRVKARLFAFLLGKRANLTSSRGDGHGSLTSHVISFERRHSALWLTLQRRERPCLNPVLVVFIFVKLVRVTAPGPLWLPGHTRVTQQQGCGNADAFMNCSPP